MRTLADQFAVALRSRFEGELLRPGDPRYAVACAVWNGQVQRRPGLIARCRSISDVEAVVRCASQDGVLTAVRCGGHSLAGFSTCNDGLVIDLSLMRTVAVEPEARRARFSGGCLLGNVDAATQQVGLAFPSGVVSHTGAAGLVLGGGFGWLTRLHGLSCDNVEEFTIVTADGRLVKANAHNDPELFWALRGGGGNFGIVTEFQVRLHKINSAVLTQAVCVGDEILRTLRFWRDYMPEAPHELKWNLSLMLATDPSLRPVLSATLVWFGEPDEGSRYLHKLVSIGKPREVRTSTVSYLALQTMADSDFPPGRRYYTKSGYFKILKDDTIECLLAAVPSIPSPKTQIELAYLGGAAAMPRPTETAFGARNAPFVINILTDWQDSTDDEANILWARQLFASMRAHMAPGVYVNFMSGDEEDRVAESYRDCWERLVSVKAAHDPKNFFKLNQNIPPRSIGAPIG